MLKILVYLDTYLLITNNNFVAPVTDMFNINRHKSSPQVT